PPRSAGPETQCPPRATAGTRPAPAETRPSSNRRSWAKRSLCSASFKEECKTEWYSVSRLARRNNEKRSATPFYKLADHALEPVAAGELFEHGIGALGLAQQLFLDAAVLLQRLLQRLQRFGAAAGLGFLQLIED
nr:hypothetical protein [Tanacetum cinerariifolium]